jgi:transposase
MSRALSVDLRVRVLAAVSDGLTHRQAGERFGVGAASVSRWRKLEREQGNPKPKALGGDRRSGRIEAHGAIRRFLKRHKITRKKRPRTPASRIAPIS